MAGLAVNQQSSGRSAQRAPAPFVTHFAVPRPAAILRVPDVTQSRSSALH
jgi:hypothetical protein